MLLGLQLTAAMLAGEADESLIADNDDGGTIGGWRGRELAWREPQTLAFLADGFLFLTQLRLGLLEVLQDLLQLGILASELRGILDLTALLAFLARHLFAQDVE